MTALTVTSAKVDTAASAASLAGIGHAICGNGRGGFRCECGSEWDWHLSDRLAAYAHVERIKLIAALAILEIEVTE